MITGKHYVIRNTEFSPSSIHTDNICTQNISSDCNLNDATQAFPSAVSSRQQLVVSFSGTQEDKRTKTIGQYHCIHGGPQLERNRNVRFGSILKGVMLEVSKQTAASLNHLPAPNHFQALSLAVSWLEIPESLLMPSWYISVLSAMQSKE